MKIPTIQGVETGSLGYSPAKNTKELDGILLQIENWKVSAFDLERVRSSFYDNKKYISKNFNRI